MTQRIVPFLGYEDAAAAIEWLERAFGFRENRDQRHEASGTIGHAELELQGARIFLSTPAAYANPRTLRAESETARRAYDNPWVIDGHFVEVDDVEAHYERARAAGATILREPEEPGVGFRIYSAEDLEGHRWMFGERLESGS
jgi:uncharacterized glyoxalase superfamily protein PhnB